MLKLACTLLLLSALAACTRTTGGPPPSPPPEDAGAVDTGFVPPGSDASMPPIETCHLAECEADFAVSCDRELSLGCGAFGGRCADFIDENMEAFAWCDCGMLGEGQGSCVGPREAAVCEGGIALIADCPPGTVCGDDPAVPGAIGCFCDNVADGVCPDPGCTADPDCTGCTPSCGTSACGDNGCGGSCGSCALGLSCQAGSCVGCTPSCAGRACGDDGCGGSCGTCSGGDTCNTASGRCESECVPDCSGRVCGRDGCGGSCGSCPSNRECEAGGGACGCPFFDRVTYVFTATGVDWSNTNFIAGNINHIDLDGTRSTTRSFLLRESEPSESVSFVGCEPNLEVRRSYSMRGGVSCMATDTVTSTSISIPGATSTGSSCTAPAL